MSASLNPRLAPAGPAAAYTGSAGERPMPLGRTPWIAAAAVAVGLLVVANRYGFHRDELYFRIAGQHPAFGYVDQPPFTPLVARLEDALFGDSAFAIRVWPALVAGAVVVLAALLCRELGGDRRTQALMSVGIATSPGVLLAGHTLSTEITDVLVWQVIVLFAVRALRTGRTQWWVAVGATVGIGLENKDLPGFLAAGLLAGLLFSRRRDVLTSRWFWVGALLAAVIAAPDLLWQATHGFPQWQVAQAQRNDTGLAGYLIAQLLVLNPVLLPAVVRGLRELWRSRQYRPIVWCFALLEVFFAVVAGKAYYPAPLLIALAAAGTANAVTSQRKPSSTRRRVALHYGLGAAFAVALLPAVLPLLPEHAFARSPYAVEDDARATIGWPQLAHQVDNVVTDLPIGPRPVAVLTQSYGEAGALQRFGHTGIPVFSGHNSLWYYGHPTDPTTVIVTVGYDRRTLADWFASCRPAATLHTPYGLDNQENGAPISICTHPRRPWAQLWPQMRHDD
jgi:4-amino-4-deoxy-L-arabinose transferase-like glycosyltransferase